MIKKEELDMKKGEVFLGMIEVNELLEHKDVFIKLLDKGIHSIRTQMYNCEFKGKEVLAYTSIDAIKAIQKDLDKLGAEYKKIITKENEEEK